MFLKKMVKQLLFGLACSKQVHCKVPQYVWLKILAQQGLKWSKTKSAMYEL